MGEPEPYRRHPRRRLTGSLVPPRGFGPLARLDRGTESLSRALAEPREVLARIQVVVDLGREHGEGEARPSPLAQATQRLVGSHRRQVRREPAAEEDGMSVARRAAPLGTT